MKPNPDINESEKIRIREWAKRWEAAGPELEQMRWEEIRATNTPKSIPLFDGLFEGAILNYPPEPTSGLVEQQRLFGKMHASRHLIGPNKFHEIQSPTANVSTYV